MVVVATTLVRDARSKRVEGSPRFSHFSQKKREVGHPLLTHPHFIVWVCKVAEGLEGDQTAVMGDGYGGGWEGPVGDGFLQDGKGGGERSCLDAQRFRSGTMGRRRSSKKP